MTGSARAAALVSLTALLGFTASTRVWVDREAVVMGTRLRVEVEADTEAEAERVIDRVFNVVLAFDETWTSTEPGSELANLRTAQLGIPVALSSQTFDVLARAWDIADRTDGAFEPAVVGRRCFDLSPATRTAVRHCADARIDNRGFGRGATLAAIETVLEDEGIARARVDFGGQLLLRGAADPEQSIEVRDPLTGASAFDWGAAVGSISTASQEDGDVRDPRTGAPVSAWGSVTVRSDDPFEADAFATALFVMGPQEGVRWLAARPELDALFVVSGASGVIACGTESILQALEPIRSTARISNSPLLSPNLRSC